MSFLPSSFNKSAALASAAQQPQGKSFEPLPPGTYTVEISDASEKLFATGRGRGLNLELWVLEPSQHATRRIWQMITIEHDNETTQSIGHQQMARLLDAVHLADLTDPQELVGLQLQVKTRIKPAQGQYEARAEVIEYRSAGGAPKAAAAPAIAPKFPVKAAPAKPAAKPAATGTGFDTMADDVPW